MGRAYIKAKNLAQWARDAISSVTKLTVARNQTTRTLSKVMMI